MPLKKSMAATLTWLSGATKASRRCAFIWTKNRVSCCASSGTAKHRLAGILQVDYSDYREANGVKVPFRWTLARPGNRFTIQVEQLQQNVPVDDSKFVIPPPPPAAGQKPSTP